MGSLHDIRLEAVKERQEEKAQRQRFDRAFAAFIAFLTDLFNDQGITTEESGNYHLIDVECEVVSGVTRGLTLAIRRNGDIFDIRSGDFKDFEKFLYYLGNLYDLLERW